MIPRRPAPEASRQAGHELRDVPIRMLAVIAALFVAFAFLSQVFLWELSRDVVPEEQVRGASPPVDMPGEAPLNKRVEAIPHPRLDPLQPLQAAPPSYRSSRPVPGEESWTQKPWDMWPDHQPQLHEYKWIEKGKVAHIAIGEAMEAVIQSKENRKSAPKEKGK